jgi:hypothetical protein
MVSRAARLHTSLRFGQFEALVGEMASENARVIGEGKIAAHALMPLASGAISDMREGEFSPACP